MQYSWYCTSTHWSTTLHASTHQWPSHSPLNPPHTCTVSFSFFSTRGLFWKRNPTSCTMALISGFSAVIMRKRWSNLGMEKNSSCSYWIRNWDTSSRHLESIWAASYTWGGRKERSARRRREEERKTERRGREKSSPYQVLEEVIIEPKTYCNWGGRMYVLFNQFILFIDSTHCH